MFTTSHFGSYKYRPINRALNLLTYELGHGQAFVFRVRNLFFHLLNVVLVFVLAVRLGKPPVVATTASLLFAVHPLTNQSVIGAVMTNTAAHSMFMLAIILFVIATQRSSFQVAYVAGAGLFGVASLFSYDANIVVFGVMAVYLFMLRFVQRQRVSRSLFVAYLLAVACALVLYLGARQILVASTYHSAARSVVHLGMATRYGAVFAAALLQLFDPVLLNQWIGAPLPSEPTFLGGVHGVALVVGTVTLGLLLMVMMFRLVRSGRPRDAWVIDAFLAIAGLLSLLPFLALADHPSETYLYLTVAPMMVVLSSLMYDLWVTLYKRQIVFVVIASCIAVVFGAATWVRNGRVATCGATARKILEATSFEGLPDDARMAFVDQGSDQAGKPYGFYRYAGLNTIANRSGARSETMKCAVQLLTGNSRITADVLAEKDPSRMGQEYSMVGYDSLVLVRSDGGISQKTLAKH